MILPFYCIARNWNNIVIYSGKVIIVIQMNGIHKVLPNNDTQPEFGQALDRAVRAGVQAAFYECHVEADSIRITGSSC